MKVLMMGGRRCGKTSALASLFYQMLYGKTTDFFTVADKTKPQTRGEKGTPDFEVIDKLSTKRLELTNHIKKQGSKTFLSDANPTNHYWDYDLEVIIPGTTNSMQITFRDANGEFYHAGGRYHFETMQFIQDCDVFVVVVDTTYLMAGTEVENEAANLRDDIHTFITSINGDDYKQVLFVPIKCEKWVREGMIEQVCDKIEETYSATIKHLKSMPKIEVTIIPVQTAGDILFSELRDSYILYDKITETTRKCSKITNRLVNLQDGSNYQITDNDILREDPNAVFEGTSIMRPSPWFYLTNAPQYRPYNCEQIPLHIIRFMFNKRRNAIWLPTWFIDIFGGITIPQLTDALLGMQQKGLIKDNVEGIRTIKRCF